MQGITKTYPNGVTALCGVNLEIERGQVRGLLGANGAGKSTLIEILSGSVPASGGQIFWQGSAVEYCSPKEASRLGIATIHQHIPLVPTLSVLENVFLGDESRWRRNASSRRRFTDLCGRIGYALDPDRLVGDLPIGQRQMVAIIQALGTGAELLVMDEPTASLSIGEREVVYRIVRHLSRVENKSIVFVSHFLDEVMALTDAVTVLRDGQAVLDAETTELDEPRLAEAIVGRELVALEHPVPQPVKPDACVLLEVSHLASSRRSLGPMSLELRAGEVLGIAGLLGSGRSELLHAIFGADPDATGTVKVRGRTIGRSPVAAVEAGVALVPEDRLNQGLVPGFEIWRNTTLPDLEGVSRLRWFPERRRERARGADAISRLRIKAGSPDIPVTELSGGNAQKVAIAKWLFSDVELFLLDEPAVGVDVGAKADILVLVRALAAAGKGVIIVSSEFESILAVSSRVLVIRDGRVVAERQADETSAHDLLLLAGGQTSAPAGTPQRLARSSPKESR